MPPWPIPGDQGCTDLMLEKFVPQALKIKPLINSIFLEIPTKNPYSRTLLADRGPPRGTWR